MHNDINAYLELDDGIITVIKLLASQHPDCEHLLSSARLLERLTERDSMYHLLYEMKVEPSNAHYTSNEVDILI